jgi:LysM repeat protein
MKKGYAVFGLVLTAVAVIALLAMAWPTTVAASDQYPTGDYWWGEYYGARWPTARPIFTRRDATINFDWGTGSPDVSVPVDDFSARWTRTIDFEGGLYKFWVTHDDGVMLWIDDQLIINQWYDQPAYLIYTHGPMLPNMHYEEVSLAAGAHRIRLEYYEHGKNAVAKLGWVPMDPNPASYTPPPATTLQTDKVHIVRPGEWLYKIARAYHLSVYDIISANGLASMKLSPGQQLAIPGAAPATDTPTDTESAYTNPAYTTPASTGCSGTHVVASGENLFRIALKHDTSIAAIAASNGMSAPYTVHVGQALCVP